MYSIIDIETTGGNKNTGRITEIAVFKHDGAKVVDSFVSLVNPGIPIPPFIVNLTGITDEMVSSAPTFEEIADELFEFTADTIFVAHNVNFDFGFIRAEFRRIGKDYNRKRLCTVQLSRETFPDLDSYSLGKITDQLGIELNGHHRAEADARATIELFERILSKKNEVGLFEVNFGLKDLSKIESPYISMEVLEEIPDDCGLFKIYNSADELLFVKRSSQILSALSKKLQQNGTKNSHELLRETYRLDWEITGSPLLSQLLEANLVLSEKPHYNFGKFSVKSRYAVYMADEGHLFLSRKRKDEDELVVFSTYYEGLNYLKNLASNNGLNYRERRFGKYLQPQVHSENGLDLLNDIVYKSSRYAIIDEAPEVNQKTIILIENEKVAGYSFLDESDQRFDLDSDQLDQSFDSFPELMMIVRQYLHKNRYEKVISLQD